MESTPVTTGPVEQNEWNFRRELTFNDTMFGWPTTWFIIATSRWTSWMSLSATSFDLGMDFMAHTLLVGR